MGKANTIVIPLPPVGAPPEAKHIYDLVRDYEVEADHIVSGLFNESVSAISAANDQRRATRRDLDAFLPRVCPEFEAKVGASPTQVLVTPTPVPTSTPLPTPKLQVLGLLTCDRALCKGTVKNISERNLGELYPGLHWFTDGGQPAGDSDSGSVQYAPLLPGQESPFTVLTINRNPLATRYSVYFIDSMGLVELQVR